MPPSSRKSVENRLLSAMKPDELRLLEDHLEPFELSIPRRLSQSMKPIEYAYFPLSGMISLVQPLADGTSTEVGIVGSEGFWGTPLLLGAETSPVEAMVQGDGLALRIRVKAFLAATNRSPALRNRLLRYTQALHVQISQTAVCNARHTVDQRLARWLLEAQQRLGLTMRLTHEFLGFMLGIRRAGVTTVLGELKAAGSIATGHGKIEIKSRKAIEAGACECYGIVAAEFKRLVP